MNTPAILSILLFVAALPADRAQAQDVPSRPATSEQFPDGSYTREYFRNSRYIPRSVASGQRFGTSAIPFRWGSSSSSSRYDALAVTNAREAEVVVIDAITQEQLAKYTGPNGINFGSSLAGADLDGNGYMDLIVGSRGGVGGGGIGIWLRGLPMPSGGGIPKTTNGQFASSLLAADLDGVPGPEIIVSDYLHSGEAGRSTGWIGVFDGITFEKRAEVSGQIEFGRLGASLSVAELPGRSTPVLLAGEPGYDGLNGRVCILDADLNMVSDLTWPDPEGQIGSGFLGVAPNGKWVIGSQFASETPLSNEGNLRIYDPATGSLDLDLDGTEEGQRLGLGVAWGQGETLLLLEAEGLGGSNLVEFDMNTGGRTPLISQLSNGASLFREPVDYFNDGKWRYLLAEPNAVGPFGQGLYGNVSTVFADRPEIRVDANVAQREDTLTYDVDFGPESAGGFFFPFASVTGDGPTTIFPGLTVALTLDAVTDRGTGIFGGFAALDEDGRGTFTFTVPAGELQLDSVPLFVSGLLLKPGGTLAGTETSLVTRVNI